ncbi:MAG TPA: hypothetical protein VFN53_06420 [Acidobacteriaceae bacterium]|nr:hypothetical protein [Acidobacteriaceae bacterium]
MQTDATLDTSKLEARLRGMADKGKMDRIIYRALRAGGEIEVAALSAASPVKAEQSSPKSTALPSGAVKSDFIAVERRDDKGQPIVIVSPGKSTRHVVRWLEYGHRIVPGRHKDAKTGKMVGGYSAAVKDRNGKKTGSFRGPGTQNGEVRPHPFVRRTWDEVRDRVRQTIQSTIVAGIKGGK